MPSFSKKSKANLATCHPDLQLLFNEVIQQVDCTIIEGHRNQDKQMAAFHTGKSRLPYPHSKHNKVPSLAVDAIFYPIDWDNTQLNLWFAGYVLGRADALYQEGKMVHRIRSGADWNHNYDVTDEKGLRDLVHFEIIL